MKLPSFIKQNSYNRFQFKPRYYDERKERLKQLEEKYNGENSNKAINLRIKGSFKKNKTTKYKNTNVLVLMIFSFLVCIAWFYLYK